MVNLMELCRYCKRKKANRPGGLCHGCYANRAARLQFPCDGDVRKPGLAIRNEEPPLPPYSTNSLPGTPEKLAVMVSRMAEGYSPNHPLDAKRDSSDEHIIGRYFERPVHEDDADSYAI